MYCHARYARVAPNTRAGTVDVKVRSDGADGSIVDVAYELTGLSDAGNKKLEGFTEQAYAQWNTEQMERAYSLWQAAAAADPQRVEGWIGAVRSVVRA